jgi:hypothetical protein
VLDEAIHLRRARRPADAGLPGVVAPRLDPRRELLLVSRSRAIRPASTESEVSTMDAAATPPAPTEHVHVLSSGRQFGSWNPNMTRERAATSAVGAETLDESGGMGRRRR